MMKHFGVYGLVFNLDQSKILLVKKTRGPYTNLYDLPGGTPEDGEGFLETLEREFQEEIGTSPNVLSCWHNIGFKVYKNTKNEDIDFHHTAKICICEVDESKIVKIEDHDTSGAEWVNVCERELLSPLVIEAMNKIFN